ncbi:hypothetical protein D9M71_689470 [compost metagenome]
MGNFQAFQVHHRFLGHLVALLHEVLEQEEIRQHRGEQLAIVVSLRFIDGFAVEQQATALGDVQTQQELDQGCLAATVLADDKDDLALAHQQVDRTDGKACGALLTRITIMHVTQLDAGDIGSQRLVARLLQVRLR